MLTTDAVVPDSAHFAPAQPSARERLVRALTPNCDRRRQPRVAAPYLLRMTPLEDLGRGRPGTPAGPPQTVVGKDLSERGFCFYHEQPLPFRYVRVAIEDPQIGCFELDIQLNRTLFSKLGWYESAGRVLEVRG
ncbi:hypothetical protein Pla123a_36060 [Posidoniimonas polymericola]|uniref:PilZ domain-containing protein n=1 Tax=Posidoniimonas polymericola TaxID=2528002 RepID=A0A5C5YFW3_9BACT|nr:hypothetical protein [Posidoniimonas polymericola]TWT73713.1 hypothetical protein Pla123a_36060 [Posidoniimonas polymericola]